MYNVDVGPPLYKCYTIFLCWLVVGQKANISLEIVIMDMKYIKLFKGLECAMLRIELWPFNYRSHLIMAVTKSKLFLTRYSQNKQKVID